MIDNKDKFDFVRELVSDTDDVEFYIGLKRKSLTDSFDFVDDLEDNDKSFFLTPAILPWLADQPNNNNVDNGEEDCVEWVENGWMDGY